MITPPKTFLILYRNRSGVGRLWPSVRDDGDFHLHESYTIVKVYELHDDATLTEVPS